MANQFWPFRQVAWELNRFDSQLHNLVPRRRKDSRGDLHVVPLYVH